ncbi:MAG: hypothetical protein WD270_04020 [Acetobacterales bacterium]
MIVTPAARAALVAVLILGLAAAPAAAPAQAQQPLPAGPHATADKAKAEEGDRHAGYYYPPPDTSETYVARAPGMPNANRTMRIGFVTGFTRELNDRPYRPGYVMFVKGGEAEKLIVVAIEDRIIVTLYQARALLAEMTGVARASPLFRDLGVAADYTFLDLLKMMGFEKVTISDGATYAHEIHID